MRKCDKMKTITGTRKMKKTQQKFTCFGEGVDSQLLIAKRQAESSDTLPLWMNVF